VPESIPATAAFGTMTPFRLLLPVAALLGPALALPPSASAAQSLADDTPPVRIQGPPPPVPPAVITRDERGNATVRAVRLTERPRIDGRLDEEWYRSVPPITGLVQSLPDEGQPATEETEIWVGFDDVNVYVSARVHDRAPESQWIANDLRRDGAQLRQNESFGVMFDTYYDRRNGVMFYTNPLGALADFQITNESNPNGDWNPIWDVRTGRFEGGWTVEMAIPFKSLRYRPGREQVWGLQIRRAIRHKNEWVHLTPIPSSAIGTGPQGALRVSAAATLVGIEAPPAGRALEVKPYAISGLRTDRAATPATSNDLHADAGLDVKYGITRNLTADFTLNTDFAQVEVDEQQVNLTRFNVSFPEKREFFLEGRGIFDFAPRGGARFMSGPPSNVPTLFFSRRIGLEAGEPVPVLGGARVTGKVGAFDVGALTIQTDDHAATASPSTNFAALRLRRDVLRRSSVGGLFTGRSRSLVGDGSSQTYGMDGTFSFLDDFSLIGYVAGTRTPGLPGEDLSYQGRFSYDADRYGLTLDHLLVGRHFNPEVGFVRRRDLRQSQASARFSPRPASIEAVRKVSLRGDLSYLANARGGFLESRVRELELQAEMENSDVLTANLVDQYENLVVPFPIAPGIVIPVGRYPFREAQVVYELGLQRRLSGNVSLQHGSFYSGTRTSVGLNRGRVTVSSRFFLEPSLSLNWVDLEEGSFATHLAVTRLNYSFSPRMFASGLVQYNTLTQTFGTNLRLRWEYAPGSELFVVFTDTRDGDLFERFPQLTDRGLVVKVTRLFRP
jgi:hypothetical protein